VADKWSASVQRPQFERIGRSAKFVAFLGIDPRSPDPVEAGRPQAAPAGIVARSLHWTAVGFF
jgi:hypothetical protein